MTLKLVVWLLSFKKSLSLSKKRLDSSFSLEELYKSLTGQVYWVPDYSNYPRQILWKRRNDSFN